MISKWKLHIFVVPQWLGGLFHGKSIDGWFGGSPILGNLHISTLILVLSCHYWSPFYHHLPTWNGEWSYCVFIVIAHNLYSCVSIYLYGNTKLSNTLGYFLGVTTIKYGDGQKNSRASDFANMVLVPCQLLNLQCWVNSNPHVWAHEVTMDTILGYYIMYINDYNNGYTWILHL